MNNAKADIHEIQNFVEQHLMIPDSDKLKN
jgi:hypothetical protein